MHKMRRCLVLLPAIALILGFMDAKAALLSVDGGLAVYDTTQNITWLANANLAATNNFGVTGINPDGSMTYPTAQAFITAMNNAAYLGVTYWRLPNTLEPDPSCGTQLSPGGGLSLQGSGTGCTGSEMGHLYTVDSIPGGPSQNLFKSTPAVTFWSGTAYTPTCGSSGNGGFYPGLWTFSFSSGVQSVSCEGLGNSWASLDVWAVARGNITGAVPEPGTVSLLGIGLVAVVVAARRRLLLG